MFIPSAIYEYELLQILLALLFISAVAIWTTRGESVLPHKVGHAPGFAHGIVQTTQRWGKIIKPELFHQRTDTALGESSLVAATIHIFVKLHVPRVWVTVSRFECSGGFHSSNIFFGKLVFPALAAKPFHGLCHHGIGVINGQPFHIRTFWH